MNKRRLLDLTWERGGVKWRRKYESSTMVIEIR